MTIKIAKRKQDVIKTIKIVATRIAKQKQETQRIVKNITTKITKWNQLIIKENAKQSDAIAKSTKNFRNAR